MIENGRGGILKSAGTRIAAYISFRSGSDPILVAANKKKSRARRNLRSKISWL